jgi:hypothetical protein
LVQANVSFVGGWQFADFVEYLNEHVYFWPGDALGLVAAGRRLLAHYVSELPLILRVRFQALLAANPDAVPLFSRYNSGAPRMQRGKPVRRSENLFRPAERSSGRPHEVIEVAFRHGVALPVETSIAAEPETWIPLAGV